MATPSNVPAVASPGDDNRLICTACGTQYDATNAKDLHESCRICDDPRQFVPPSGQSFTSLAEMRKSGIYTNKTRVDSDDDRIVSIWTEPKFAIGQRAFLIRGDEGNVLWDLITYLDQATIDLVRSLGGIQAIVISHPHYYTSWDVWARAFGARVYFAVEDEEWLCSSNSLGLAVPIESTEMEIVKGVTAVKVGGHFPGSMMLHYRDRMFTADSVVTTPSALYHVDRLPGTTSFSFMWSVPNMIPLPPDEIMKIWKVVRRYDFTRTHGAFNGWDVHDVRVKARLLESAKIAIRAMGYKDREILAEVWE